MLKIPAQKNSLSALSTPSRSKWYAHPGTVNALSQPSGTLTSQHCEGTRGFPLQGKPQIQQICSVEQNHLLIHLIFTRHTTNVQQALSSRAKHALQPSKLSAALYPQEEVSKCWQKKGRSMHSGYPIWDRYAKLESPGVPTLIKLGGAQGERTTICNYL